MISFFNAVRRWIFRKPPPEKEVPPPWHFTFLDDPDPPNMWTFAPCELRQTFQFADSASGQTFQFAEVSNLQQSYTFAETRTGQSLETVLNAH